MHYIYFEYVHNRTILKFDVLEWYTPHMAPHMYFSLPGIFTIIKLQLRNVKKIGYLLRFLNSFTIKVASLGHYYIILFHIPYFFE